MAKTVTANELKKEIKTFYRITNAEAKAFSAEVKRIYSRVFNKTTRGISRDNYLERMGMIIEGMKQLGLDKEIADLKKTFARQYKDAEDILRTRFEVDKKDPQFGLGKEEVAALIKVRTDYITENIFSKVPEVQTEIQSQILTGQMNWDKLDDIADTYGGQSETYVKTAMTSFYRVVNVGIATDAGIDLFYYEGVEDDRNRDFCEDLLKKDPPIYTYEEIKGMDNGQGLDVFTSGGGWNCRHQWMGVTLGQALELGYKEDGR